MKKGVDALANAVKVTLGPKGRNVVLEKKFGAPSITKDGVTVAKEIELEDPIENMGAQMVKEVASKTADIAGDGTTTATVLAQAIISEGLKNVAAGANPMDLKRGIDKAVKAVVESLKKQSEKIGNDHGKIEQVAAISANNDSEIGKLIAEAMTKVTKDGVITVGAGARSPHRANAARSPERRPCVQITVSIITDSTSAPPRLVRSLVLKTAMVGSTACAIAPLDTNTSVAAGKIGSSARTPFQGPGQASHADGDRTGRKKPADCAPHPRPTGR